ncbi:MAG: outer membrane beta-barrel protein [Chthoniobacterales bacterium]
MSDRNTRVRGLLALTVVLASLAGSLAYADPPESSSQTASGSSGEASTGPSSSQSSTGASSGQSSTGAFSRLPFELSATVQGGYDDNVGTTNGGTQGSPFSLVGLQLAYNLGSPRTQISFHGGANLTYYWDHPQGLGFSGNQEYDIALTGGLSIQHKASPRLTLTADLSAAYLTEPQFSDNISSQRRNGNFFYAQDQLSAAYLWAPRFQTVTSYTLFALAYDEQSIALFEDRYQHTIGNEFKFIWQPQTALVLESRLELVNYNHEGDFVGNRLVPIGFFEIPIPQFLQQDSVTYFVLGGIDHNFSSRLSVSLRGGAQFRDFVDGDRNETAPYFEAALNYTAGRRTTLIWTNRYGLEEPDTAMNPVRTTFRSGLQVSYAFTQKINASGGIYFVHDDYHTGPPTTVNLPFFGRITVPGEPGFSEQSVDLSGRISYAMTRHLFVEIGFSHTEIDSAFSVHDFVNHRDLFLRNYSRSRGYCGLTYAF